MQQEIDTKRVEIMELAFSTLRKLINADDDSLFGTFMSYIFDGYLSQKNKTTDEKLIFIEAMKGCIKSYDEEGRKYG